LIIKDDQTVLSVNLYSLSDEILRCR